MDQLHKGCADKNDVELCFSWKGIDNVIEQIDTIKKELMMIIEGTTIQELVPTVSNPAHSSSPSPGGNNTMVGFDERLDQIIDELTGDECDLQVLPIYGVGGNGKTTLARNAFDNSYTMRHFDIRTWLTVSLEYSMQGILLDLLKELGYEKYKEGDASLAEFGAQVYQILYDRKYLVVMDDVWSTEILHNLRSFFPNSSNGSRIMVTTRLLDVADCLGSQKPYVMDFLDEDNSWDLLCKKTFAKDGCCNAELEEVGKSIAKGCKGLPLAIVAIGGLLSKSNMTQEYWECVAKDVNSFTISIDEQCLKILTLSYNHLPIHLKPCFLYMRVFPEDAEIQVSKLIKLQVAEGFLKPFEGKTLEEVAEQYLKDFIDRNLLLIHRCKLTGIRKCSIHDLLRELCLRESQKEHFHRVPKVQPAQSKVRTYFINSERCFLCGRRNPSTKKIHLPQIRGNSQPTSLACYSVCDACRIMHPQLDRSRLVRAIVLSPVESLAPSEHHHQFPTTLRYLDNYVPVRYQDHRKFGRDIKVALLSLLWNLQALIISDGILTYSIILPSEIWDMPQLRHLRISKAVLRDPPRIRGSITILENLQTLVNIRNFRCSGEIVKRIPNLKKLYIRYNHDIKGMKWSYYSLHNLVCLRGLKTLLLESCILKEISFPHSLKKLRLVSCPFTQEEMTMLGSMP